MLNIVLFGPPGAGKGTQSKKLIDRYQLVHLSTGDMLRAEISAGTSLGLKAKSIMDKGELVSDEIVVGMIESQIDKNKAAKGFIFDGFPRTAAQAEALDKMLERKNAPINMMIAIEVDNVELVRRLLIRGHESGRADDQNEEVIKNRIVEYNNKTAPLKKYYSQQGKFHSVYGIGTVDQIFELLCATIDNKTQPKKIEHDGIVTVADISSEAEPASKLKGENKKAQKDSSLLKSKSKAISKSIEKVKKLAKPVSKTSKKTSSKTVSKKPVKKVKTKVDSKKAIVKKIVSKSKAKTVQAVKSVKSSAKKTIKVAVKKSKLPQNKSKKSPVAKKKISKKSSVKKAIGKKLTKRSSVVKKKK